MTTWPHHPDDELSPRFGNHWSNDFNTYEDCCNFYGIETPAQLAADAEYEAEASWIEAQDVLEARGTPKFRTVYANDEIPY
jgi:hypothetical protein